MTEQNNISLGAILIEKPFDGFEIHPCRFVDEDGNVEQCDKADADMYSVYVHYEEGGLECIFDCEHEDQAEVIVQLLESLIKKSALSLKVIL